MASTAQTLAADQSTTLATAVDTAFIAALEANKVYFVLCYWRGVGTVGASLKFGLTGPAGATVTGWHTGFGSGATQEANRQEITALAGTLSTNANSNGINIGCGHFWARVKTGGTAGNLTMQIASSIAGTTVTLKAFSWWTVDEITAGEV